MKNIFFLAVVAIFLFVGSVGAQVVEYSLPKTEVHFRVQVEKNDYRPGEFAIYSERYLKKAAESEAQTTYRLLGITPYTMAQADEEKHFSLPVDRKHTIFNLELDRNGVLMAINSQPQKSTVPQVFKAAPRQPEVNPHDFMSQDILAAGSTAKMAELTAREIYDIRDSRNQLSRGEADFMPKDGEQLKIMLGNLDTQEKILLQTFQGSVQNDTLEYDLTFVPDSTQEVLLFRMSKYLGMVDSDDLGGEPYYVLVENMNETVEVEMPVAQKKKEEIGVKVNLPGKARVKVLGPDSKVCVNTEMLMAQFGRLELLPMTLFGKKMVTKVVLDPVNGNVLRLDAEPLD